MTSRALVRAFILIVGVCLPVIELAAATKAFDARSFAAIKAAHGGRPFVLAFWSIHCAPCLEDMADWRTLRTRHPNVPILLVNTDAMADQKRVQEALARFPPGDVEHWEFADDFAERVRYSVDRTWRGELPRTYFFDRSHQATLVSGRLELAWVEAWFSRQR
jgi:hypothetical protein